MIEYCRSFAVGILAITLLSTELFADETENSLSPNLQSLNWILGRWDHIATDEFEVHDFAAVPTKDKSSIVVTYSVNGKYCGAPHADIKEIITWDNNKKRFDVSYTVKSAGFDTGGDDAPSGTGKYVLSNSEAPNTLVGEGNFSGERRFRTRSSTKVEKIERNVDVKLIRVSDDNFQATGFGSWYRASKPFFTEFKRRGT